MKIITFRLSDGCIVKFENWTIKKACHCIRHRGYKKNDILSIRIDKMLKR